MYLWCGKGFELFSENNFGLDKKAMLRSMRYLCTYDFSFCHDNDITHTSISLDGIVSIDAASFTLAETALSFSLITVCTFLHGHESLYDCSYIAVYHIKYVPFLLLEYWLSVPRRCRFFSLAEWLARTIFPHEQRTTARICVNESSQRNQKRRKNSREKKVFSISQHDFVLSFSVQWFEDHISVASMHFSIF